MHLAIIVPGRLASTRFPKKLLHEIAGKPLITHTADRIRSEVPEIPIFFAVDHIDLVKALRVAGYDAIMTRDDHPSGTDRIAEANAEIGADHVINVQADEPLVTKSQIETLAELIERSEVDLATLAHRFQKPEDFANPNQVKVVTGVSGHALYFSRSPIPFFRDNSGQVDASWLENNPVYRHLGLYAYKASFLKAYNELKPTYLEQMEKLEQLRALENGYRIAVGITEASSIGVDTLEDAENYQRILSDQS
jgi:3-deoxy-manno-octulosonate cytidylyltransferase (CMP-KDO synthetase)